VAGRHLQFPWWEAIPLPPDPEDDTQATDMAPTAIVIPADVLFTSGSSTVRSQTIDKLEAFARQLAPFLVTTPGQWTIAGATDGTGAADSNATLGRSRATNVLEIIAAIDGIDPDRFHVETWGETRPEVDETTAPDLTEARARNRRVVIIPPNPN
jgi:outer membrane protein OmpA-like peptidoglycan-associated protein